MFKLIGSNTFSEYDEDDTTKIIMSTTEIVATFDSKKDAKRYVRNARLTNPGICDERQFKKRSLLGNFEHANVEEIVEELPPPHNPIL